MPGATYTFSKSHRIRSRAEFSAVFEARRKAVVGPIIAYARPNNLPHLRLGLSVPKAAGSAPRRNRIKRLLREAFRLHQHDLPQGYDMILVIRPHEPLLLADYQKLVGKDFEAGLATIKQISESNR